MNDKEKKLNDLLSQQKKIHGGLTFRLAGIILLAVIVAFCREMYKDSPLLLVFYYCLLGFEIAAACMIMIQWIASGRNQKKIRKELEQMKTLAYTGNTGEWSSKWIGGLAGNSDVVKSVSRIPLLMLLPIYGLSVLLYWQKITPPPSRKIKTIQDTAEKETKNTLLADDLYSYSNYRYAAGSEKRLVQAHFYESAGEWMQGRIIPPQVLYEDDRYRLEITGTSFEDDKMKIHTVFTNNSDHDVKVNCKDVFANDIIASVYGGTSFRLSDKVLKGTEQKADIVLYKNVIYPFDPYLEKYEFRMEVADSYKTSSDPENKYLTTDPIFIRTEPADGEEDREFRITMDPEMKVLFENEDVRVIRTGIFEKLTYKEDRIYDGNTSWQFLIENRSDKNMLIDHRSCTVNREKALSELIDEEWIEVEDFEPDLLNEDFYAETNRLPKEVYAGRRRTISFELSRTEGYEANESVKETETEKTVTASDEEDDDDGYIRLEYWPLEEIETGSAAFTIHYTDKNGQKHDVQIEDQLTGTD